MHSLFNYIEPEKYWDITFREGSPGLTEEQGYHLLERYYRNITKDTNTVITRFVSYTPSWNDGEPCTKHGSYEYYTELEEFEDYIDFEKDFAKEFEKIYETRKEKPQIKPYSLQRIEDFFFLYLWPDNTEIFLWIDAEDKFHYKKKDYDCGY